MPQVERHRKWRYEKLVMNCPCLRRTVGEVRFFETVYTREGETEGVLITVVNYGHEWHGLRQESCLWILGEDRVWRRQSWPGKVGNL